jgi:hypothetical protein
MSKILWKGSINFSLIHASTNVSVRCASVERRHTHEYR